MRRGISSSDPAGLGESRDDEEVSELQAGDDDTPSELGQIVLVGVGDPFEDTVDAKALDHARDLRGGHSREQLQEMSAPQSVDHEVAPDDDLAEAGVLTGEEIEALVAPLAVARRLRDFVESPHSRLAIVD